MPDISEELPSGRCVFCGVVGRDTPEGALTKEHAYPDWIRKKIKPIGPVHWRLDDVPIPSFDTFDVEIDAVCQACNTRWLSDNLETKISKRIGGALTNAKYQLEFDRPQRSLLAAWAVKTALMVELALRAQVPTRDHALAPKFAFDWLYVHRELPTPPPGTQVWMFGVNIGGGFGLKRLAWAKGGTLEPLSETDQVPPAYFHTFTAGSLGFQVFGSDLDGAFVSRRDDPPRLPLLPGLGDVLQQVWPAPKKPPFRWPPKKPRKWVSLTSLDELSHWPDYLPRPPSHSAAT